MFSSTRQAAACILLIFSAVVSSSSQTNPEKVANASVSGKVTLKNKGVAGVVVYAQEQNSRGWNRSQFRATTDQTGSYRITNLPGGTYIVRPIAPSLAFEDEARNNAVVISDDENLEDINFAMVPGGVITGKVTDSDGKPVIEEYVSVLPLDSTIISGRMMNPIRTDDRGIYRAFGLRKGKYKVSVGQEESLPGGLRPSYVQTFYPSVTDVAKATVIEVTEGSETTNVDIVVGRPQSTFRVSGRILDAETGKPLPKIKYGVYRSRGEHGGSSTTGGAVTNANGEFRLDNVLPGKYSVFIVAEEGVRGDSVSFEVVDRDVTELVINAGKAASVSGVVVIEGTEQTVSKFKPGDLYVSAWVESREEQNFSGGYSQRVNPDGTFRIGGLRKGITHFGFSSPTRSDFQRLTLVRVERDGVVLPRDLILKEGEQVAGVRLVLKYLTGAIHGQVKVEGDELQPNTHISLWITRIDDTRPGYQNTSGNSSPQLDARRRFTIDGLQAGTYEVNVAVFEPNRQDTNRIYKEQVTVADNVVSNVTITIKTGP